MRDYSAPSLPLSRSNFSNALHVGHGRARLHLDTFGIGDLRDVVLEAAITCKTYDPQVEGFYAAWFADFCEGAQIVPTVIATSPGGEHWDKAWRCALLAQFALRGHSGARDALYRTCREVEHGELYGVDEIIELDGVDGLAFVANKLGQLILVDRSPAVDGTEFWSFDAEHGEGAALRVLEELSAASSPIHAYLTRVREKVSTGPTSSTWRRLSVDEQVAVILAAKRPIHGLGPWARDLGDDALLPILRIALSHDESSVIENALRCLSGSRVLSFTPELWPLVRHSDANIRLFAARALGRHIDTSVRETGVALLAEDTPTALELLRRNALPEDGNTLSKSLSYVDDIHERHSICSHVNQLLEDCPGVREPGLALYVYEHSPCRHCRASAVRHLRAWDACPGWLLDEGRFDASEEIRELVAQVRMSHHP